MKNSQGVMPKTVIYWLFLPCSAVFLMAACASGPAGTTAPPPLVAAAPPTLAAAPSPPVATSIPASTLAPSPKSALTTAPPPAGGTQPSPMAAPRPEPTMSLSPVTTPESLRTPAAAVLSPSPPRWREVSAPPGVSIAGAQWIAVEAPGGREILAAVFRPQGSGPFPVVVVLHGTEGFRVSHVELARYYASNGLVSVAGAWFGGHYILGAERGAPPVPTAHLAGDIKWPNGPDIPDMSRLFTGTAAIASNAIPLIDAVRALPGVKADRVGVFGHSRGASAAILTATTNVQAVVSAAGPGAWLPDTVIRIKAPVLLIHGDNDEHFNVEDVRNLEGALIAAGKTVEAYYFEGAPHRFPWLPQWQEAARQRSLAFFKKYLSP